MAPPANQKLTDESSGTKSLPYLEVATTWRPKGKSNRQERQLARELPRSHRYHKETMDAGETVANPYARPTPEFSMSGPRQTKEPKGGHMMGEDTEKNKGGKQPKGNDDWKL